MPFPVTKKAFGNVLKKAPYRTPANSVEEFEVIKEWCDTLGRLNELYGPHGTRIFAFVLLSKAKVIARQNEPRVYENVFDFLEECQESGLAIFTEQEIRENTECARNLYFKFIANVEQLREQGHENAPALAAQSLIKTIEKEYQQQYELWQSIFFSFVAFMQAMEETGQRTEIHRLFALLELESQKATKKQLR